MIGVVGASATTTYFYQQQNTKVLQSSDLNNQVNQHQGQISSPNAQITGLNKQIDSLNSQITQLQVLNNQLGGNNAQLTSEIQQLQTQVSQLQLQVQDLTARLKLQSSRVIASMVCIYSDCPGGTGGNQIGSQVFINPGTINYSGYLRVSWTGAHASFTAQVFDVNITTPATTSGIFSVPVSANATGNAWFTNYDCTPIPAGTFCPPVTYSMTY